MFKKDDLFIFTSLIYLFIFLYGLKARILILPSGIKVYERTCWFNFT